LFFVVGFDSKVPCSRDLMHKKEIGAGADVPT
jgi:hypothetical protein